MLPYLAGDKRRKALYMLEKYKHRTSMPVLAPRNFKGFGGMI